MFEKNFDNLLGKAKKSETLLLMRQKNITTS